MNKKTILYILLDLVFLVVFNIIFFVSGGAKQPASVWISYGFIHFAYFMVIATPFLTRKSSSVAIFGFSLYSISSTYFLVEFVIGIIFIFLKGDAYKVSIVFQIIIAGIYIVLFLSHLIANEHTADSIERHENEVTYIRNAALRVNTLVGKLNDKKANKQIEKVYDLLHSSPTRSIADVSSLETEVVNTVCELENAVFLADVNRAITISEKIISLMEERNRIIRLKN